MKRVIHAGRVLVRALVLLVALVLMLLIGRMASADTLTVAPVPVTAGAFTLAPLPVSLTATGITLCFIPGSFGDSAQVLSYQWQELTDGTEWRNLTGGELHGGVFRSKGGAIITKLCGTTTVASLATTSLRFIGTLIGTDITIGLEVTY